MKRKYISILVLALCLMLSACDGKDEGKISEKEPVENEIFLSDGSETEIQEDSKNEELLELCSDIYKNIDPSEENSKAIKQLVDALGEKGYTAIDSENLIDMTHSDHVKDFLSKKETGEKSDVSIVRVSYSGGLFVYDLQTENSEVSIRQTCYQCQNGEFLETMSSELAVTFFEYTKEGYLVFEGSFYSPEQYVLTMSEGNEHAAIRVDALDPECRELCEKYLRPISYGLNNVFITEWNSGDFGELDFYDVFALFYSEVYQEDFPYLSNADLSVGNEYYVQASEFEKVIMKHFDVTAQELQSTLRYEPNKEAYIFRPRGFYEHDYAKIPSPEVVSYTENNDGSLTLLVNAVYANENTSRLFSHEVTVKDSDEGFYYLSNHIIDEKLPELWWHSERLTDEEWKDYYQTN